jgi:hypothetical protein
MFVSLFNDALNKSDCILSNAVVTVSHMLDSDCGLFNVLCPQLPRGVLQLFCVLNPCDSMAKPTDPFSENAFPYIQ